ncbi:MAG: hypothetical protein WC563_10390 [Brevundimonas sp.]
MSDQTITSQENWYDGLCRIEHLIHIASQVSVERPADVFSETFIDSLPEDAQALLYQQCPVLSTFGEQDDAPDAEEVAEILAMRNVQGFFIQAAQPVVQHFYESGGYSYSWGWYHTEWLYAATASDIEAVVWAWSANRLTKDREKAAAKKAEATHA